MAAAVADFRPPAAAETKLKKDGRATSSSLALEPTPDVLTGPGGRPPRGARRLVGFAAEHGAGAVAYGRDKLARKGLDAIVVNDIARPDIGFEGARQRGHDRDRRGRAPCPARREGRGGVRGPRGRNELRGGGDHGMRVSMR